MPPNFISFQVSFTSAKCIKETEKQNGFKLLINESKAIKSRWSKFVINAIRFTALNSLNGVFSGMAKTGYATTLDNFSGYTTNQINIFLILTTRSHDDNSRTIFFRIA